MPVRPARAADAERLRAIERAAGRAFRDVGLAAIADDEPLPSQVLAGYADAGRAWVATDPDDEPLGYAVVDVIDGCAHIEQISVHPDHQGRGVGRELIDTVDRWAAAHALAALTLTTFADVAWNAPLYAHLGFRTLAPSEVTDGLRELLRTEEAHGLDPSQRVCMRRPVGPSTRH